MLANAALGIVALSLVCPSVERVSLGVLATRVHEFAERPITVCGVLWRRSSADPSEYIYWGGLGSNASFFLDASRLENLTDDQSICVTGVARRRDGIPVAEIRARGIGERTTADGMGSPEYVLYPVTSCISQP